MVVQLAVVIFSKFDGCCQFFRLLPTLVVVVFTRSCVCGVCKWTSHFKDL